MKTEEVLTLNNESERALFNFAELFIETLNEEKQLLEPLEQYIHDVKMRLYVDKEHFQQNFLKGYRILIAGLAQKK